MNDKSPRPPSDSISRAEEEARQGRQRSGGCIKSNRGASVFTLERFTTCKGGGYNGPPGDFRCTGTDDCRKRCGSICQHAEVRAIHEAMLTPPAYGGPPLPSSCGLVHVKIGTDGLVMPGGPPSCPSCSGMILDVGFIAEVWLYEESVRCGLCEAGVAFVADGVHRIGRGPATMPCRISKPAWRRYTAEEFHRRSLEGAKSKSA
jgi:hypothetical protein